MPDGPHRGRLGPPTVGRTLHRAGQPADIGTPGAIGAPSGIPEMERKPYVSAALAHLRHGVTFTALAVGICAVVQLIVFGFVHFTEVRWDEDASRSDVQPLSVVATPVSRQPPGAFNVRRDSSLPPPADADAVRVLTSPTPAGGGTIPTTALREVRPVRAVGVGDVYLRRTSDLAVTLGVVAALALAMLTMLGVVVAGGASVPGVEKAVSACTWALGMALLSIPWRDALDSLPFPGVFSGYRTLTAASEAVDAGAASAAAMFGAHLILPLGMLAAAITVALRFHAGVDAGLIVTSVSELDEALEREMAGIRRQGVGYNISSRAVGVLNQAIGEKPAAAPAAAPNGTASGTMLRAKAAARDRRIGDPDSGDPLKRPI